MSSKLTTIPSEAIEWMTKKVTNFKIDREDMVSRLTRFGLSTLIVGDLKQLCRAMEEVSCYRVSLRGYKSGTKNTIIQLIRNHFYTDYPDCQEPNVAWLNQQMTGATAAAPSYSASLARSAAASAITTAQRYPALAAALAVNLDESPPLSSRSGGPPASILTALATSPPPQYSPAPTAFSLEAPPVALPTMPAQHPAAASHHHHPRTPACAASLAEPQRCSEWSHKRKHHETLPAPKSAHEALIHTLFQHGPSGSSAPRVSNSPIYIKPECALADPDGTAHTQTEKNALAQLQQMSFTDPREILFSCRKLCRETGSEPSVDSIMLDIITQREEADEARQMDEARKLSELSRKEDAKQRREELNRELQNTIESSSVDVWLRDKRMFVQSWILRGDVKASLQSWITTQKTLFKLKLIDLLKLERNSQKWYGDMPRSYFAGQLMQRLVPMKTAETMKAQIHREINTLETAMYGLSQQTGGVPKVFRDAHDEAVAEIHESHVDEEDVVLLVQSPRPTETRLDQSQVSLSSAAASFKVIDLS